ncbi:MAG: TetR/AcrR family transcriptional regulator [Desulfobacterales bacterium]
MVYFRSVSTPPANKSERTRRFIIEKVAPVFNKKGYAGTSIADLTTATGLTKGSIYGNFRNKEEVAIRAFDYNVGMIIDRLKAHRRGAVSAVDRLLAYPKTYRDLYRRILGIGGCPVLNTAMDADHTHSGLHALAVARIDTWKQDIVTTVERGKIDKEILPSTDGEKIAATIIVLIEGGSAMAKTTGDHTYIVHAVEGIEALIETIRIR